jgi:hypothetical protein
MKAAVEQARVQGDRRLPEAGRRAFVVRYEALMAAGLAAGPTRPRPSAVQARAAASSRHPRAICQADLVSAALG